jgi:hypothetical protein
MNATHLPTDRSAWRTIVAEIAAKAKETLPECNGRVDKAVALVLAGGVELLPDGTARVESCSDPTMTYEVNGACPCKDYERAPSHWCKHRIAAGIQKRVDARMPPPVPDAPLAPQHHEAPASLNLRVLISGHETMITLRDSDETRLLDRLHTLLKRGDIRPIPKPAPRQGNWKKQYQGR